MAAISSGGDCAVLRCTTTDQMKRRWWSTFWRMIRLVEKKEAEDRGDYWKTGEQPPWYA